MSSDARKRAVRVLADYDARHADNEIARAHRCAEALRALLASEPACCSCHYEEQRFCKYHGPLLASEPAKGEMGAAVGYTARVNAPPASDAVREAAERLRGRLGIVSHLGCSGENVECVAWELLAALDAQGGDR